MTKQDTDAVPLPSLTKFGAQNDGEHEHLCQKCDRPYNCPHPHICRMEYKVDECGKCNIKRMNGIAFPGIPENSNGVAYVGPDGTPLKPLNYKLPDPENLPSFLKKGMLELVEADKERSQEKAARLAKKQAKTDESKSN